MLKLVAICVFISAVAISLGIITQVPIEPKPEFSYTTFYDVYYVEAPFGILWIDVKGGFIFGCGQISSTLHESYIVKFWDERGQIRSLTIDATNCPILVDGTFRLEFSRENALLKYKPTFNDAPLKAQVILHLPFLPTVNSTISGYGT